MLIKKRFFAASLSTLLASIMLFTACSTPGSSNPDGTVTTAPSDETTETSSPTDTDSPHSLRDKFDPRINAIYPVAGTFTDRLDASALTEAMKLGQAPDAGPLLYNLIGLMKLTREDIVLYSEMNGDTLLLENELIDGLFLEGDAMREALRGDYTIMAGGIPYTVYDLAALSAEELTALNIPADELKSFLITVKETAARTGESLAGDPEDLIAAFTAE